MQDYRGRELEYLVDPFPLADFLRIHWDKKPLHVPGRPEKFAAAYDLGGWAQLRSFRSITATKRGDNGVDREISVEPGQVHLLFHAGLTICADVSGDPKLGPLLAGMCRRLKLAGWPPFAKLYASNDGGGFSLHTDPYHVFVLQIAGSKLWRFSRTPAVRSSMYGVKLNEAGEAVTKFPREGELLTDDDGRVIEPPKPDELESALLNPGDLLYLPPGTWHVAKAQGHSIAVSISPPRGTAFHLFTRVLEEMLMQKVDWRRDIAVLAREEVPAGRIEPSVEATIAARLSELRAMVDAIDPRVFHRAWRMAVAGTAPGGGSAGAAAVEGAVEVERGDLLGPGDDGPISYLTAPGRDGAEQVFVYYREEEWSLGPEMLGFVSELARAGRFRAETALKWDSKVGWENAADLLSQLVRIGALKKL